MDGIDAHGAVDQLVLVLVVGLLTEAAITLQKTFEWVVLAIDDIWVL